jgi:hypothetical protein
MRGDDLAELAATLTEANDASEAALLPAIAWAHCVGVPLARRAGIDVDAFDNDDHRVIWSKLCTAADESLDKVTAARLVRAALQKSGHWFGPGSWGRCWTDRHVAQLFESHPTSLHVPALAAAHLELRTRWRRVQRLAAAFETAIRHAAQLVHPRRVRRETRAA